MQCVSGVQFLLERCYWLDKKDNAHFYCWEDACCSYIYDYNGDRGDYCSNLFLFPHWIGEPTEPTDDHNTNTKQPLRLHPNSSLLHKEILCLSVCAVLENLSIAGPTFNRPREPLDTSPAMVDGSDRSRWLYEHCIIYISSYRFPRSWN